ncbi:MAG: helix-turn-helix domain-containing protein [Hyphomicrobiaceae bacterium]|nr:helix-turn-helix domain-containing protein [Hyphomicrobiaceae bacterium]
MLDLLDLNKQSRRTAYLSQNHISCCSTDFSKTTTRITLGYPFLSEVGKLYAYKKNDIIFWDGEVSSSVYFLVSGVVRGTKLFCDGRRQVTRFAFAGEILEHAHLKHIPFTAEAVTDIVAHIIPRQCLDDAMDAKPELRRLVMVSILDELHETQCRITALARLTAQERVAQFLHNIYLRSSADNDGVFHLPMQRQDIADYLGLTIETVSRIFSKLKRENRIHLLSSNRVKIPNLPTFKTELLANLA